ncbi:hypothetical protein I6F50_17300 [Pseudoalteromonas sp. NZS127_1]|uniref:hypothetical protein n=1 Tax=Pseudoalteromonas sp. NZS127_1 TaxID=2792074 RepID=UPI0018CF1A66|nr:hypothetical protein [Pseudoalteromonas sp. NZS127_1]MBG9996809.1 hypothetical protein [Pseudoalteromonas sp. NZS127_1]
MIKFKGVSQIEGKDNRLIESCLRILLSKNFQLNASFESPVEGARVINEFIASREIEQKEKDQMALSLIDEAKQALLPLDEFSWFKDDERACYFVWASIYLNSYYSAPNHPATATQLQSPTYNPYYYDPSSPTATAPSPTPQYALSYSQLGLKNNLSNSMERFNEVVKYFDRVRQLKEWKLGLITHLKGIWGHIFSSRKPFPWLEKDNDEQCRWAWEYMRKTDSYSSSKPMTYRFTPTSTAEIYLAIYAVYDTWNVAPDSKRLFSIDFNKAWQQKKLRDGRQGKKACSLVLHKDIKLKLDELAKTRKVTLSQLVEQLIEKEHLLKDS